MRATGFEAFSSVVYEVDVYFLKSLDVEAFAVPPGILYANYKLVSQLVMANVRCLLRSDESMHAGKILPALYCTMGTVLVSSGRWSVSRDWTAVSHSGDFAATGATTLVPPALM